MKVKQTKWLFVAIVCFILGIYSLIFREASNQSAPSFPHFDKFGHFMLFWLQTWLNAQYWLVANRKPPYWRLFIFGLLYAIGSELAQHFFTETRQGDVWDVCADMLGVCVGLQIAHWRAQVQKGI